MHMISDSLVEYKVRMKGEHPDMPVGLKELHKEILGCNWPKVSDAIIFNEKYGDSPKRILLYPASLIAGLAPVSLIALFPVGMDILFPEGPFRVFSILSVAWGLPVAILYSAHVLSKMIQDIGIYLYRSILTIKVFSALKALNEDREVSFSALLEAFNLSNDVAFIFSNNLTNMITRTISMENLPLSAGLISAVDDKHASTKRSGEKARFNADDIPMLTAVLRSDSQDIRRSAAKAINEEAVSMFCATLNDEDGNIHCIAAEALGKIGKKEAIPALIPALKDKDSRVRCAAAEALGKIGNKEAAPALLESLKDENNHVRYLSAKALLLIDDKSIEKESGCDYRSVLQAYILIGEDAQGKDIVNDLFKIGKPAVPALLAALKDKNENENVRCFAAEAIGKIGEKGTIPFLREALNDVENVIYASVKALGKIGGKEAVPALTAVLVKEENKDICCAAAEALGKIREKEALPALMVALKKTDFWVSHAVERALIEIGEPTVAALIPALKDKDSRVRCAAAEALGKIGEKEAAPALLESLKDENNHVRYLSAKALLLIDDKSIEKESGCDYRSALQAYILIGEGWLRGDIANDLVKIGKPAVPALLAALQHENDTEYVQRAAVNALAQMCEARAVAALLTAKKTSRINNEIDEAITIILSNRNLDRSTLSDILETNPPLWVLMLIQRNNPLLLEPYLRNFLRSVNSELEAHPETDQKPLLSQFSESINFYLEKGKLTGESKHEEYRKIGSLLQLVHDNLPLCLNSLNSAAIRLGEIQELIKALPLNNPLTRIIRMIGENESLVGGCLDVIQLVKKNGKFRYLYGLILEAAKGKQRAAPQEVSGILETLKKYKEMDVLQNWSDGDWQEFSCDIQKYYGLGFKTITMNFFSYFKAHKSDKPALEKLKEDIEKESKEIAWGTFWGWSKGFKNRYGFSQLDELAILAKYMQISNFSGKDYISTYEKVKNTLSEKKPEKWQKELPLSLRSLYALKGGSTVISYQPDADEDRVKLDELLKGLSSSAGTSDLSLKDIFNTKKMPTPAQLKSLVVSLIISDRTYFQNIPQGAAERRSFLSRWHNLLADTMIQDFKPILKKRLEEEVEGKYLDIAAAEAILESFGFRFVNISSANKLFKVDPEFEMIANDKEKMKDYFLRKWLPQIIYKNVQVEAVFSLWIERGLGKFISQMKRPPKDPERIRSALFKAREQYLSELKGTLSLRKRQLKDRILDHLIKLFADDTASIEKQLKNFKGLSVGSKEDLCVGLFDDLLHLSGEYMMTGVCTGPDRPRQIQEGMKEGYHFATIALKDTSGRVLGFSQVQILKTPLNNMEDKSNQGYRVLSLTGINLFQGAITIDREKAILAILMAAKQMAEKSGLQKAVIVYNSGLHSNQQEVKTYIEELAMAGYLKKGLLTEDVRLSKSPPYKYKEVYTIESLPEIDVKPATISEITAPVEKERSLLEKNHLSFCDGLGHIIHNGELKGEEALLLKSRTEEIIKTIPEGVIGNLRLNLQIQDIAFNLIHEPSLKDSRISIAKEGITLYLGKDIIYGKGKVETLALRELISEAIAASILQDYDKLNEASDFNENAFFKLEIIKALLNYKAYLALYHKYINRYRWEAKDLWDEKKPEERAALIREHKASLDRFTEGIKAIYQWNIFMNVMDDADPHFMTANYIHIFLRDNIFSENDIQSIIFKISEFDVLNKASIASIRNILKEFLFNGKVHLKIGEEIIEKGKFNNFDNTERISQIKDTLLTTQDRNTFYQSLNSLLVMLIPLSDEQKNEETVKLLDKDLFASVNREGDIKEAMKELLIRRIGKSAFSELVDHLKASRGFEVIPYIELLQDELNEGQNADDYEVLRYASADGSNYSLAGGRGDEQPQDWVCNLFRMKLE